MSCELTYEVCSAGSHPCFKHKVRYQRERGRGGILRPSETFRNGTIKEQQTEIIARSRANGYDPVPVEGRSYYGPA